MSNFQLEDEPTPNPCPVFRGGCWNVNDPAWVRAARRGWLAVTFRVNVLGFRCARGGLRRVTP